MTAPWRDRDRLAALLAAWRARATGRPLHRIDAGPGWTSLHLEGDLRPALFLGALPGAVLAFPFTAPLPDPLRTVLSPTRGHPLGGLLRQATLVDLALLADDLILQLTFTAPAGPRLLRHQLFGNRGGTVVLDERGRLLWTAHPGPHPRLVAPEMPLAPPGIPADDLEPWTATGLCRLARQQETALGDRLQRRLAQRRRTADRLVANLTGDLERADDGQERRRDAEALAAHLHAVPRGAAEITVTDPRDGTPRTISLDPARPAHGNLEHLFKLARKAARGREIIVERRRAAVAESDELARLETELADLLGGPVEPEEPFDAIGRRLAALHAFATANAALASEGVAKPGRAPEEPTRPFRRFLIDGRWQVWVGRSNQENDVLTHRASHVQDLWLHAQGVAGSHVVVRTGGRPDTVPRQVLEKAAALAAHFSKARHSGLVPVIWTERRYVRKPRKATPGVAVCLREQNLFVEPGIVAGVEPA